MDEERDLVPVVLCCVVDVEASSYAAGGIDPLDVFQALLVLVNAHLALNANNKVAIYAAAADGCTLLYFSEEAAGGRRPSTDGLNEAFAIADEAIASRLKDSFNKSATTSRPSGDVGETTIAVGLAMAMCFVNRLEQRKAKGTELASRIVVFSASKDNPALYLKVMNVLFSALKKNILVDIVALSNESMAFLEQASDVTGGVFVRCTNGKHLRQLMMNTFSVPTQIRYLLCLPLPDSVDYRASCSVTKKVIDTGYVCSVCLSVVSGPPSMALPTTCPICEVKFDPIIS